MLSLTDKRWCYGFLALFLCLGVAAQQWRLFERAWFGAVSWFHAEHLRERSLWLNGYQVAIEAKAIDGLSDLSALTFDPYRRSLFTVSNKAPQLIELSLTGELLRVIALKGFEDPEAIEFVGPNTYVIAEERAQRLVKVHIDESTQELQAADFQHLELGLNLNGNKGFEGLAYDAQGQRLLVAKERDPLQILEVRGFVANTPESPLGLSVQTDAQRDKRLFVRDLSSLDFDQASGHLLALSDESKLVIELDRQGLPVSTLALRAGQHGLRQSVPHAEGLASDADGNLYLISEPNLFYLFRPAG